MAVAPRPGTDPSMEPTAPAPVPASWRHDRAASTALLLVNLGTPDAPNAPALRRYLAEFLSDPRVVEIPRVAWWPILHGVVLRTRPSRSAAKYASIWRDDGVSPLAHWTARQADAVRAALAARGHDVAGALDAEGAPAASAADGGAPMLRVAWAMRYGRPSIASTLDALAAAGAERVLVLPLYPQYAAATHASVFDAVAAWAGRTRRVPELRFVHGYADDAALLDALAAAVREHWRAEGRGERLVMSFHGLPARTLALGDPYHCHCHATARQLAERLGLAPGEWLVTFQSRLGRARWLEPYTEPTVRALAADGVRRVDVVCPGFAADNLETLEEIGVEVRDAFVAAGGQRLALVPCLNDRPDGIAALAGIAERHLAGWPTRADARPPATELDARRERARALGAPR